MNQNTERVFSGLPGGDFWVFGYGSLMWNPGFSFKEKKSAVLTGFKRSLCVWSWHHRGTESRPGLVFGLDEAENGEACQGCAYHVADEHRADTLDYLHKRELINDVYRASILPISIYPREELALTFVVDPKSAQYAGKLNAQRCAAVIARAQGRSGHNTDYVLETWRYLQEKHIQDNQLQEIAEILKVL